MSSVPFLHMDALSDWLDRMAQDRRVVAPVKEGAAVVFRPVSRAEDVVMDRAADMSPRWVLMPQCEELFRYEKGTDPETGKPFVRQAVPEPVGETVVFGARPCDARGVAVLDEVFLKGPVVDPYYAKRRELTTVIAVACDGPRDKSCFCHWTDGSPVGTDGADIVLFRLGNGYAAEAVTDKGAALLESAATVGDDIADELESFKDKAAHSMGEPTDMTTAGAKFAGAFDDVDFWQELANPCNGCGACANICPTCQCFNITDDTSADTGRRIRTWDTCMSPTFTLEASGHNPRSMGAHRWRNRVGHKLRYHAERGFTGLNCTGCGRCVRVCPSCMDIRESIVALLERNDD